MPAARNARSAASGEPARPASAARSVLRRCAKAASTQLKTACRPATEAGGSCRVKATSPESTFGTGQNTERGTPPARRTLAHHAAFTDGTP